MAKVRVYELAKELNMESKKLVEKLQSGGVQRDELVRRVGIDV